MKKIDAEIETTMPGRTSETTASLAHADHGPQVRDVEEFPFPVQPTFSNECGEGWAAGRSLEQGEVVLRVAALAAVPRDRFRAQVCAGCFTAGHPPQSGARAATHEVPCDQHAPETSGVHVTGKLQLTPCHDCRFVSFCSSCRQCRWRSWRHAQECESLQLLAAETGCNLEGTFESQPSGQLIDPRPKSVGSHPEATSGSRAAELAAPASQQATRHGPADAPADTTALRLILQLACSRAADARGGSGGSCPLSDGDEACEGRASWFGPQPAIMDGMAEDVDALCGDEMDVFPPEVLQLYVELCKRVRHLLPARFRTSLERLMVLACQCHLNGMDITLPPVQPLPGVITHPASSHQSQQAPSKRVSRRASGAQGASTRHGLPGGMQDLDPSLDPSSATWQVLDQGMAVGEGLFPSAARFNHSCEPCVGLSFDEWGCLVATASRAVGMEEELLISYVGVSPPQLPSDRLPQSSTSPRRKGAKRDKRKLYDPADARVRDARRERLQKTYLFECKCTLCARGR